jgi:hypothetical protein
MDLPRRYTVLKLLAEKQCYRENKIQATPIRQATALLGWRSLCLSRLLIHRRKDEPWAAVAILRAGHAAEDTSPSANLGPKVYLCRDDQPRILDLTSR